MSLDRSGRERSKNQQGYLTGVLGAQDGAAVVVVEHVGGKRAFEVVAVLVLEHLPLLLLLVLGRLDIVGGLLLGGARLFLFSGLRFVLGALGGGRAGGLDGFYNTRLGSASGRWPGEGLCGGARGLDLSAGKFSPARAGARRSLAEIILHLPWPSLQSCSSLAKVFLRMLQTSANWAI